MIRIITDSTSDLSQAEAAQLNVSIVPLKVIFSESAYKDGVDLKPEEFYEKLQTSKTLPTTSQPTPNEFLPFFEEAKQAGDDVIVLLISSKLSGTVQSASIAKDTCAYEKIHIIDSLQASISLQALVHLAIKLRNEQKDVQEIVKILENRKKSLHLILVVSTLEYLQKGGRLSKTAALAGSLLGIKPVVGLVDGSVQALGKGRGFSKAFAEVANLIGKNDGIDTELPVCFGYTGANDNLSSFTEQLASLYEGSTPTTHIMGSVIGTHVGPGGCAIAYFDKV